MERIKRLAVSFFLGVVVFAAIAFLISSNWKIYQKKAGLGEKVSEMKDESEVLERKNLELKENLNYIQSGEYLEKMAREQLDMKKPGEEVIVIQKQKEDDLPQKNESWWTKIKSIFAK